MLTKIMPPLAALWYAFGFSQMAMAYVANAAAAPAVIWLAYALATLGGLAGAVLLWTRRYAFPVFAASLASALIYYAWLFSVGPATSQDYPIAAMVLVVTSLLTMYSRRRAVPA